MTKEPPAKEHYKDLSESKLKIYDENAKLCRAIQAQPCIYDRSFSHQHKDILKAWTAIATACEDTVPSCKVRWQNIRSAFMRSLQATKTRPNRTRNYYLHDVLEFLIPHMTSNNSSDTEDEMEEIETDKTEKPQRSVGKSPVKQSSTPDEERTTSANETAEDEQTSPRSGKKNAEKFFIKEQSSKVGTFIIKKNQQTQDANKASEDVDDGVKILEDTEEIRKEKQVETLEKKSYKNTMVEATAKAVKSEVEADGRQFRFRRACKRSMDKSIVQQLRNPSPKRDTESKRTRRSLAARRATLKPKVDSPKSTEKTTPEMLQTIKKQPEQEQNQLEKPVSPLEQTPQTNHIMEQMLTNHSFIPSDIVETQMRSSPGPEQPVLIEWTSTPTSNSFLADSKQSCVPFLLPASLLKYDRAVQCDQEIQRSACDDEFLNMLRPQMAAMNARQKLHFKQRIYKSLIEVFDDTTNFPNSDEVPAASAFPVPPFPGVSSTTGAEMCLIRELVSLVQAAKLTPELMKSQDKKHDNRVTANFDKTTTVRNEVAKTSTEVATTQTDTPITPPLVEPSKKVIYRSHPTEHAMDGATQRQLMRKVVKVSGVTTEGEKRCIYRILPKGSSSASTNQIPSSGVGTFIIPRAPGSIASSVNAAAAAAAASSSRSNAGFGSQDSVYRQIPVSGGTVYVGAAGATGSNSTTPNTRRLMTIRSTVRPSGTCVPRQILRRYSVCGSGNMTSMDNISTNNTITTTVNTPPHQGKSGLNTNPNSPNVRYVRATATATPPFKQPQTPITTVTQSVTTRTSPSTPQVNHILPDKPEAMPTNPPAGDPLTFSLSGFNAVFPVSGASTSYVASPAKASTVTAKNSTKTTNSPRLAAKAKEKKLAGQVGNQGSKSVSPPKEKHEDTAGVISSDYFGSFNIKNEPLD